MTQGRCRPSDRGRRGALRQVLAKVVDHPRSSLAVGLLGVVATFATFALSETTSTSTQPKDSKSPAEPAPSRGRSPAPSPLLSSDASCGDLRKTATRMHGGRLLVDSPGQISGTLSARLLPSGRFHQLLSATIGDEVEFSALLDNPSYSAAENVSAAALISADHGMCWRIVLAAHTSSLPSADPRLGPTLIRLRHGSSARLVYVAGSTRLFDEQGHILAANLADSVTRHGLSIPYAVPGGTTYYLNFRCRIELRRRRSSS